MQIVIFVSVNIKYNIITSFWKKSKYVNIINKERKNKQWNWMINMQINITDEEYYSDDATKTLLEYLEEYV